MTERETLGSLDVAPLVQALFDPWAEVRVAIFGALIRLPLGHSDWLEVASYTGWVLKSGDSLTERLAVIDAVPSMPIRSVKTLARRLAEEGRGEIKARAHRAAKLSDPAALIETIARGGADQLEAARSLARADVVAVSKRVGELCRHDVARESEARFWLAVALALSGEDEALKTIFKEIGWGKRYEYVEAYSSLSNELDSPWYAHTPTLILRRVLAGRSFPKATMSWLSEVSQRSDDPVARAMAAALLEAQSASHLDPPLIRGRAPGFAMPSAPMLRESYASLESTPAKELWGGQYPETLDEDLMGPLLERGLAGEAVALLFERAVQEGIGFSNPIVGWVGRHQERFQPDLQGLFRAYQRVAVMEWKQYENAEGASARFISGDNDESFSRWLCWQIAWTVSRAGLRGLVPGLAGFLQSRDAMERMAAGFLIADAADYVSIPNAPRFGGGTGPLRQTPNQEVIEDADGVRESDRVTPGAHLYQVWFATSRGLAQPGNPSLGFANEPDPDGVIRYGTCTVEIPRTHRFGSIGTPWYQRWLRLQFSNDHLRVVTRVPVEAEEFFQDLRVVNGDLVEADRVLLVYLHGYNVSFDEGAIRAAQVGFDLGVPGATALFSWPSCSSAAAYMADADRVAASENQIAQFLTRIATESGARVVHIIAHSMGNRGLARAIQRIMVRATSEGHVRFGQIVLAAPDIEVALFKDLAAIYPSISERTTMYVSARDKALGLSKWLQKSNRAGYTPPITVVPQIDTIEVTDIDLTMLGHAYYAEAEPVLYDIHELLSHNQPPSARLRLEKTGSEQARYWVFRK